MATHHISLLPSFLILLILLVVALPSASVFLSIDCGASDSHTDENNIKWESDKSYIQTGEIAVAQGDNSVTKALTTLRVFTSKKKNCYQIPVAGGGKILLRVSFYYGNYDKKSSPPTFALMFDGNKWDTVATLPDGLVYYETVYVVNEDTTSVCVAQTDPSQYPFVSAIEVRSLESAMYGQVDSNVALFLAGRSAFGAPRTVRYPDDPYDRIWYPVAASTSNGLTALKSDTNVTVTGLPDSPPASAVQTAVTPTDPSNFITLTTGLPDVTVPIYMNMYFTEMSQLSSTDKRSFQLYVDGSPYSDPMNATYGNVDESNLTNETASGSTQFSLRATSDATLPPIITAMEVFSVSDVLSKGTNPTDVKALASLQGQFNVLQEWSGDPCLPATYNWEWVGCSSDQTPRITALNLHGLGLSGHLPDFSALDALETIDLSNNSLTGGIPDYLGNMPNLKELNLADNSFSAPIPSSLSKNNKITLVFSGNPNLCASGKSCETSSSSSPTSPGTTRTPSTSGNKKKSSNLGLILGLTTPLSFIVLAIAGGVFFLRSRRAAAPVAAASPERSNAAGKPGTPTGKPRVQTRHQVATDDETRSKDGEKDIEMQMESEEVDVAEEEQEEEVVEEACVDEEAVNERNGKESRAQPGKPRVSGGNRKNAPGKPRSQPGQPRKAARGRATSKNGKSTPNNGEEADHEEEETELGEEEETNNEVGSEYPEEEEEAHEEDDGQRTA